MADYPLDRQDYRTQQDLINLINASLRSSKDKNARVTVTFSVVDEGVRGDDHHYVLVITATLGRKFLPKFQWGFFFDRRTAPREFLAVMQRDKKIFLLGLQSYNLSVQQLDTGKWVVTVPAPVLKPH